MAVVTVKSQAITNRDSTPSVMNDAANFKGRLQSFIASAAITSGDSVGSKYILGSIPSNAVVHSLLVTSPDIGTTTVADVGLYKSTADGGAVVDVDYFDDALSLKDGALANLDVAFNNALTTANCHKKVWEGLALSADPSLMYDVVLTLEGAADATGTVMVKLVYAV